MSRHISVGVPVYKGKDQVGRALRSLQEQTFREFEAIISIDGADAESADACLPFLSDSRFRMVVQPQRLDWYGNFNWLLGQPMGDFFCYRQHDDWTEPDFFERLLLLADRHPEAAILYTDCRWHGGRDDLDAAPSIEGDTLSRLRRFIEEKRPEPVRGIIRAAAVAQAGPVRADEFRALSEVFVWLAKVLRWGSFVRLPEPLYHRLDHSDNYHKQWFDWPVERKRESWSTLFTGLLEAVEPACGTIEERLFFQHFILDRIAVLRPEQSYHHLPHSPHESGTTIRTCLERLAKEGHPDRWIEPTSLATPALSAALAERDRLLERVDALQSANRALAEENRHRRASRAGRFFRRLLGRGGG
ncbi:glycosyltransferase family 2 protein [Aquibium sp. ELW1220]|uniref:glycosyltransferase family 2 protein n=1 Tax=Aquibium sp. ELW1220 TaxID=2976766 RepID=UPI0025B0E952|nr:glycosyltransferase family 2 protein [Aquibium sp. ELW1220]MDN2582556.1 glycosyltransferase family 2 protein [Aquibium sp. ELW1220]